ncbi:hypothetical protein ONE63_001999 [Megalurothrips usitatus]|uniref:Ketosynthase family 3 (KS3) domain-containing protein n=1 Tax=Megalurothrips usitatus TaxID=439358 RepID=A0AAV7XD87_9NEOP|nr:hypothetical protein ONE63_001999 [Megalurothrips usitatus]
MSETEVVISGIGGLFPQSQCVQDFGRDLLENKHLPTPTNRWKYDVNPVCGQTSFEHFDDVFYGINRRLAASTDPVSKLGYLRSFEAIVDAGLHPHHMRGAKVAVYAGTGIDEFEQMTMSSGFATRTEGYLVMGISKTMFPNRISYFFDFRGPSCAMDGSWASMHLQMELASKAIRDGSVDGALIVSANVNRFPNIPYQLKGLGLLSKDNLTRSFDEDASGSVPSDCSVAFFLQRADQAKRCYATVLASGIKFTGRASTVDITLPDPRGIQDFLQNLYTSHAVDPKRIAYLEADGSGHAIRDETELCAIDAALVKGSGREGALLVGSVKSNIGHTDSVSAMAGVCKAVVAMETGVIPASINYRRPNPRIPGLVDGRLRVVDSNTPLQLAADSVVAVNTLGVCNTVGHTVLRPNRRGPRTPQRPDEHLPRLITLSGRTEEGVREVAKKVQSMPFDTTYYRMVQDVFSANIRGYDYRTYVICPSEEVPHVERMEKRVVWFAYSGMGSQWAGMGSGLMGLPVFAETIERMHAVLVPKGLDLKAVITETGPEAFNNILKSFVGITACQIALTNVLKAVGVVPDFIVGHSVGELGCAYADGCLTEEQTILAAYARGVASTQAPLIKGMMAAIGLGHKDIRPRLPPSIDVACHNSATSCTLSGPAEDVKTFVKQLSDEGVFARAVNVSDIAYHSRYIQPAAPFLREQLEKVIPNPKRRSNKWVSTSVPEDQLESDLAKYCSAAYQTNNLLSPVLFEEALTYIPQQALVVEVAPHGLLQAILKRALPECKHIALTQRDHDDPLRFLLSAIGKTAVASCEPDVAKLYPDVEWPAPRGTGSLASLVTWQFDESSKIDTFQHVIEKVKSTHNSCL